MQNKKIVYLNLIIISASVLCFEILSTRISSVVFVNNYAFIILSLAILGLGCGGIYSYYKIKRKESEELSRFFAKRIALIGIAFSFFLIALTKLNITNPFIYFLLLFLPFFFAGIVYSQFFKLFAETSFKLYASDLTGAAIGSLGSIGIFHFFSAPNAILFLSLVIFCSALSFLTPAFNKKKITGIYFILFILGVLLLIKGTSNLTGKVPVGKFDEKDFYYVYPDAENISQIIDSRWSIHGRSDLVAYTNQDQVRQLFIDGAAGTQMYRFGGDVKKFNPLLYNLLIRHTTTIPLLFLRDYEKDSMLVIGPGGGKEVLTGLLNGISNITGIEINSDFVEMVKEYKDFNGGIYTDFPNIQILVEEGRHYIKKTDQQFDLIVMALPSTEQLQNIDNLAMNENYLLTVESLKDYLKILTPEGRLVFTVHNRWELIRLIVTAFTALKEEGINYKEAVNHFIIIAQDYAPTIVIKKKAFNEGEIAYIKSVIARIPKELPSVTYLPYNLKTAPNTRENQLLKSIEQGETAINNYISNDPYDITPVRDDSPYFYKVKRGIPDDYFWLLIGIIVLCLCVILIPYSIIKNKMKRNERKALTVPLLIFICIGAGFMIVEVSLFQKLILYLGSPTVSLSILLSSLLIGMGSGSYFGGKIYNQNYLKRLYIITLLIVAAGTVFFILYPIILNGLLTYNLYLRSVISFLMILPLGFLLGIPFPTSLQILKSAKKENLIPWMYGVNGTMSVLGSVAAVILSMIFGFTFSFFAGLLFYAVIFFLIKEKLKIAG